MKPARPSELCNSSGFTLVELLVTILIFSVIALAVGSLYLSTVRAMDNGSTMIFVQRQGTQIQEELARYMQRATALQVDPPGATISLCQPREGVNLSPGKSMIYQRTLGSSTSPTTPATDEYWCVYEYQRTGGDAGGTDTYPQLWRCQVSGLTPPQVCLTTPAPENLVASAQRGYSRQPIAVSGTCFTPAGTARKPSTPCSPPASPGCQTCVDVSFALDVMQSASGQSLLGGSRTFGFNITNRN